LDFKDCWDQSDLLEKRVLWEIMDLEVSLVAQESEVIRALMEMLEPLE